MIDTSLTRLAALLVSVSPGPSERLPPIPKVADALDNAVNSEGLTQERWLEIAAILEARGRQ